MGVPNTNTFTLQNVVDVVNPTSNDLADCFADAISNNFDATYSGSKNSLLNFRNYHTATTETFNFTTTKNGVVGIGVADYGTGSLSVSWVSTGVIVSSGTNTSIDLTGNTGSTNVVVTVYIPAGKEFSYFLCISMSVTALDISSNTSLIALLCNNNNLNTLDISNNTYLETIWTDNNNLTTLDLSSNTLLDSVLCFNNNLTTTSKDNVYIDLDANGLSNGDLQIDAGRSSASNTARANLITRGWSISD